MRCARYPEPPTPFRSTSSLSEIRDNFGISVCNGYFEHSEVRRHHMQCGLALSFCPWYTCKTPTPHPNPIYDHLITEIYTEVWFYLRNQAWPRILCWNPCHRPNSFQPERRKWRPKWSGPSSSSSAFPQPPTPFPKGSRYIQSVNKIIFIGWTPSRSKNTVCVKAREDTAESKVFNTVRASKAWLLLGHKENDV